MKARVIDTQDPLNGSLVEVKAIVNGHFDCLILNSKSDAFNAGEHELIRPKNLDFKAINKYKIDLMHWDETLIQTVTILAFDVEDAGEKVKPFADEFNAKLTSFPELIND